MRVRSHYNEKLALKEDYDVTYLLPSCIIYFVLSHLALGNIFIILLIIVLILILVHVTIIILLMPPIPNPQVPPPSTPLQLGLHPIPRPPGDREGRCLGQEARHHGRPVDEADVRVSSATHSRHAPVGGFCHALNSGMLPILPILGRAVGIPRSLSSRRPSQA